MSDLLDPSTPSHASLQSLHFSLACLHTPSQPQHTHPTADSSVCPPSLFQPKSLSAFSHFVFPRTMNQSSSRRHAWLLFGSADCGENLLQVPLSSGRTSVCLSRPSTRAAKCWNLQPCTLSYCGRTNSPLRSRSLFHNIALRSWKRHTYKLSRRSAGTGGTSRYR